MRLKNILERENEKLKSIFPILLNMFGFEEKES